MRRTAAILAAYTLTGCAATPAPLPPQEPDPLQDGLPLLVPPAPPPIQHVAAGPAIAPKLRCDRLQIDVPQNMRDPFGAVVAQAMPAAMAPAAAAICACARGPEAHLLFLLTPDRGALAIRSGDRDERVDACLAAHLPEAAFPRFHFGTDCIHCGPQRFGLFPGNPPADADPPDGIGSVGFPVVARERAPTQ